MLRLAFDFIITWRETRTRPNAYEMQDQAALLGANAVVGVDLDYETVGDSGSMLMVTASGTAVRIED